MTAATTEPYPDGVQACTAYADDLYRWAMEQAATLRAGHFSVLDRENLAEEIESPGRSEFYALVEAWRCILLHMLKCDLQPDGPLRDWASTIEGQRIRAAYLLADSPSLTLRLDEALTRAYCGARLDAAGDTGLSVQTFPETCPYTRDDLLTRDFPIDPTT
ncbi:protein of unknown function DUF29 [Methylobacterium sp. 174MFSha1.1]|uniref:DUF29 domain-containing protein n=1 Tax=Methylobacterium sp. 174MFSha1.1 TaxID=1502749 RepID=UPI0008E1C3F7|nr:DUF29 domain-containing protein [Methylobacterium sp. 174MFSha1.1]SFU31774.1 protein of unknown function DUF29 [Methylobacterium sp. 174MFSha1.1]